MDKKSFVLTLIFCAALVGGSAGPAHALNPCEKQAAQCNRETDLSFREEKRALGKKDARKLMEQRRFECRALLKKCTKVTARNRDLRMSGGGGSSGGFGTGGGQRSPGYTPGN